MADYCIAWRLANEGPATGTGSYRIGDIASLTDGLHEWNSKERTKYGVAKLTDVPDVAHARLHERVEKVKLTQDLGDGYALVDLAGMAEEFPHRFQLYADELKVQFPLDTMLIDDLYNDKIEVPTDKVPVWPWAKVKACFWDRVQAKKVLDVEKETTVTVVG